MGTYNYTFKSVVFESVQAKSVKIKKSSEALGWSKKLFVRRFENDTFESVEIESVVVSAHPTYIFRYCLHTFGSKLKKILHMFVNVILTYTHYSRKENYTLTIWNIEFSNYRPCNS